MSRKKRQLSARTAQLGKRSSKPPAKRPKTPRGTRTYDAAAVRAIGAEVKAWAKRDLAPLTAKMPLRKKAFATDSGIPIPDLITLADRKEEIQEELELPGRFPFTRGVQPSMYRGRLWTM